MLRFRPGGPGRGEKRVRGVVVVLEAPTSKVKVIHDWPKMQPNWPTNHSLWIPAGSRLDFLSAAMAAIQKAFPARFPFVVQ